MSLRFFIGASGAGKSYRVYHDIIEESMKNVQTNYFIIVPDQFTMQTQKDICLMHPNKGIMNIDVLSFGRLAHRVFEEVGGNEYPVLDDTGKNLILRKVAANQQDDLVIMKNNLRQNGYIHEIKSSISEFMQYGLGVDDVKKLADFSEKKGALSYKLKDLATLYDAFLNYNREKYITTEEQLTILKEVIGKSEHIKESVFVFDGFTGFTPVQNNLIQQLLLLAKEVIVTVTMDDLTNPYEALAEQKLFHLSQRTIAALCQKAKEVDVARGQDVIIKGEVSKRLEGNKELAFLERHLFRYDNQCFQEENEAISLIEATTVQEEIREVCHEIYRLVRNKNYRYQDIAVVTGNLEDYASVCQREFAKVGIPFFLDATKGIMLNPFIEYIKSAIEMVVNSYSYESVFHYLRSGLTDATLEEIDVLENYALELGIRGKKKWQEMFTRRTRDMKEGEEGSGELTSINAIRAKVMDPISSFSNRKKKASEFTMQLYQFIESSKLQEKLQGLANQFEEEQDFARAKEYTQIYRYVMDLLDQMMSLLGEEEMTLSEYAQILTAGFDEIQIGMIPQNADQVVIGDIERTRLKEIKALFFVGVNDGVIPKAGGSGGIISDMEREFLRESEFELSPTPRQKMFVQRLYLYLNMTKPTEYLYLSYAQINQKGDSMRPAYLIQTMERLFTKLIKKQVPISDLAENITTAKDGFEYFISMLRQYLDGNLGVESKEEIAFFTLSKWYDSKEEYTNFVKLMQRAGLYHKDDQALPKVIAQAIYGTTIENSVSRLERFASCAYSHFLQYGLQLQERNLYSFEQVDMGNIFHRVLEIFSGKLTQNGYSWFDFTKDVAENLVEEAIQAAAVEYGETILYSSSRNEYLINRMKRILIRTVTTLQYQLKKGLFKPAHFEMSFRMLSDLEGLSVSLSNDEKMYLRGRIDRVDTYEDEEKVYVKVIDYKSGAKNFNIVSLYYGLQLQLVVYLNAAIEMEKKHHPKKEVVPAAILYYHVNDPCIATEGKAMSEEEINQNILQKLRMNGVVNDQSSIIEKLDTSLTKKSDVIPVEYKTDGSFTTSASVMNEAQLQMMSTFVNKKIKEIGRGILDGNKEINPYEMGTSSSCAYCSYRSICKFDGRIEGYQMRVLGDMTKDEALEQIQKEVEDE